MRRFVPLLALAVLSLAFAPAPLPKPDPSKADLDRLQGVWDITEEIYEGRPEPRRPEVQVKIEPNRLTFLVRGKPADSYELTVNARAKPKQFDLKGAGGLSCVALYALERDTVAFCWTRGFVPAPRDISGKGPKAWRMVFKRVRR